MQPDIVVVVMTQVVGILSLSRLIGVLCGKLKQPQVIGEIIAGILLGPSFLGQLAPQLAQAIFPASTLPLLDLLAQLGLVFFVFLVGLEFDPGLLAGLGRVAALASHASVVGPFVAGTALTVWLYPLLSNASVSFSAFALFVGAAMSITAFPVLARILRESELHHTPLGNLALTCAAFNDVVAWCILALAIAVARTRAFTAAVPTLALTVAFAAFMFTVGRWGVRAALRRYDRGGRLPDGALAAIYVGVALAAVATERVGAHYIFGAFIAGAVFPKHGAVAEEIQARTEGFVASFLLPVFFTMSGLRTRVGLLDRPRLWVVCGVIFALAVLSKYASTYLAARVAGLARPESSALGWLLNTRGLTELIVLNVGLRLGVISPALFTMLVIMALGTTLMATPLLRLTYLRGSVPSRLGRPRAPARVAAPAARARLEAVGE